ncbi:YbhB/YbcL family Raf kinase inhibitor-like protein [Vallicoccus soli]|uniref:YbhB/YbcL family Raf kinase inhibitor-like protein n=1 Tax=Vallicoccus soli TaxID=2339232 RepID=A0A3A3Z191_9ACTN|nr:YbhB/YbcL family Raf kinase inhibitor-like protein [Vallicoccus soli]RJK96352.1 YbhB/YbcL family Raf kinase inhibitor-like protein [Vallicoccus soli]
MSLDRPRAEDPYAKLPAVPSFQVVSDDLVDGAPMPLDHVDDAAGGGGVSPHLRWSGAPEGTRSYAVTCFDPDAPTPSGYWHWCVVDLPATTTELARGADADLPAPAYGVRNDGGDVTYQGAAPPPGDVPHRYYYVVHAVDVAELGPGRDPSPAVVSFNLAFHTLARAVLVATHQQPAQG